MKNQAKIYSIAINFLIDYWGRYSNLDDWHMEWIQRYVRVRVLKKGELLYIEGESQSRVFIVMEGLLFRNILREDNKCRFYKRYLLFVRLLPELHQLLMHQEVADLLGFSLSSVKRYHKRWLWEE